MKELKNQLKKESCYTTILTTARIRGVEKIKLAYSDQPDAVPKVCIVLACVFKMCTCTCMYSVHCIDVYYYTLIFVVVVIYVVVVVVGYSSSGEYEVL